MFGLVMAVFFAWSREKGAPTAASAGSNPRRRSNLRHPGQLPSGRQRRPWPGIAGRRRPRPASARPASARGQETVDDDEHLAAYNAFLARINKPQDR